MILSRLTLRDFRNLGAQELAFPASGAAIVGDNAQGKSNLLEAIYYLETFRSFRGAKDPQMVAFGADVFRVEGEVGTTERESVAAAYDRVSKKKRVSIDGQVAASVTAALGHLGAVVFSPSDIARVAGGPVERRRFLDIVLSLNRPGYVKRLQEYRHALTQRNAALKARGPAAAVRAWDDGLSRAGAELIDVRQAWVDDVARAFTSTYITVSGGEEARMEYVSSVKQRGGGDCAPDRGVSESETTPSQGHGYTEACFREALEASFDRDQRFGNTSVGPHRDELRISFGGGTSAEDQEVRTFGSGGQRRTAALALRLVEASTVRRTRGRDPLVLLDDAFAELDEARSSRLLELIDDGGVGQVILTAPKESDVRVRADVLPRWRIEGGRIEA